ncbi:helix-turn-helix domain-containing protein [Mesorhizobium sp. AA22]|uniref:helix-turn-helix transcriptional regulator n=1 Tax=Mesorhizobium sp. AA22 TaxID=1854057 RepID=UPI0007EC6438|nr:helix-turn-helix domain-containing protein [Mesorhizobium sp. AA22]QIA23107.1 helix-turn-helix domain-containing protein [Mesorhizobium sp. AA22]
MLFSTKDAAARIGKSPSWLNKSRMTGDGPVYLKLGGSVRYALADLEAWLAAGRRTAVYDHANDNARAMRPQTRAA